MSLDDWNYTMEANLISNYSLIRKFAPRMKERGTGSIRMRAVTEVEEVRKGRTAIVVTEMPYQVSIERVISKIKTLVDAKKITGIADVRDESDSRKGMSLIIELKRDAIPQVVLTQPYNDPPLQDSFGYNMVSLVDGVPLTLGVAEMIGHYLDQDAIGAVRHGINSEEDTRGVSRNHRHDDHRHAA